jgi:hypothetical protein
MSATQGARVSAGYLRSPQRLLATRDLLIGLLVCHPHNEVVELGILVKRARRESVWNDGQKQNKGLR